MPNSQSGELTATASLSKTFRDYAWTACEQLGLSTLELYTLPQIPGSHSYGESAGASKGLIGLLCNRASGALWYLVFWLWIVRGSEKIKLLLKCSSQPTTLKNCVDLIKRKTTIYVHCWPGGPPRPVGAMLLVEFLMTLRFSAMFLRRVLWLHAVWQRLPPP